MPTETPTLALCSDLSAAEAVREQHDRETGVRKRHTHTMSGALIPADCEIWTRHGQEIDHVLKPDGSAAFTHPLPAKPLKPDVAAKVTAITASACARFRVLLDRPPAGPVTHERGNPKKTG